MILRRILTASPAHNVRNSAACLTSCIAWVTLIPRGQAAVQLKTVRHLNTPSRWERISSRSREPSSRESKMKRCAFTMAAGPTYSSSDQKIGHEVVQAAHRMHL